MALRRPLCRIGGVLKELPVGDTLPVNAVFTGTATLPLLTLVVAASTTTFTVTPAVSGDSLVVGEPITVTPAADLPNGLNIAWARVVGTNQVRLGLTTVLAVSLTTAVFTVVATR